MSGPPERGVQNCPGGIAGKDTFYLPIAQSSSDDVREQAQLLSYGGAK
ncbi:hypothetical protein H9Y04_09625 [Streptomyces sp. TRM66268-LWL]|uniref:Uncharacterized protein n=1 Tax=Streptomyces polyasparticus TaxID=2767826 RepID=A0ABR7SBI0_9ACTN|nr:hypothetical protein [Streptomyces polyasparticus]MBC9712831.1 hypothetical protein [Streptomyces polyasparticus]